MTKKKYIPKIFTPRTSFWIGMGSVINIPGNYYDFNGFDEGFVLDQKAIASDWKEVGRDISQAIDEVTEENKVN